MNLIIEIFSLVVTVFLSVVGFVFFAVSCILISGFALAMIIPNVPEVENEHQ